MLTVNALAAANHLIIPVQAEYLSSKGLEQSLQTVAKVWRQINPKLQIDGILLAMVDNQTNFSNIPEHDFDVKEWVSKHCDADTYIKLFGPIAE